MTRVTNFGRKREYLDAGFATGAAPTANEDRTKRKITDADQGDSVPPKKKRKRAKTDGDRQPLDDFEAKSKSDAKRKARKVFSGKKEAGKPKKRDGEKSVATSGYQKRTEQRRLKRITDRQIETVCYACREKGHTAKNCSKTAGEGEDKDTNTTSTVGMCYRCGSIKHTLSRCKTSIDPLNPLPFASCFVCSGKGHLASSCPRNKEKGIYPNGGSCKLCGEKSHLAKDCELRQKDMAGTVATTIFGTGNGAGADEDDFHTFKRKNSEVSKDEKKDDKRKKQLDVKAGLHTGTVKVFGTNQIASKSKKAVYF